jgi:Tol biopolymer transport system component
MTDEKRRLRRLDEIEARDLWSDVEARADGPEQPSPVLEGPSAGRRLVTIGVAFAVFAAAGSFLYTRFDQSGSRVGDPSPFTDKAPEGGQPSGELRVTCTDGGTSVEGSPVKLLPDGLHIRVVNETATEVFYMRDPEKVGESAGFDLDGRMTERVFIGVEPGTWVAACFPSGAFESPPPLDAYSAPFEIVDPDGLWGDLEDAQECGEPLIDPLPTAEQGGAMTAAPSGRLLVNSWGGVTRGDVVEYNIGSGQGASVLAEEIDAFDAQWSPDGTQVAFVGEDDGDPEIYVVNADGSRIVQLTYNDATDDLVQWSPDGSQLSFRSNRDGPLTLYAMKADGSDQRRLVTFPSADRHAWSPDGERIAFVGSDGLDDGDGCYSGPHEDHELYVMDADGTDITRLTDDEWYEQDPAWSPDGRTIAFSASDQSDYRWDIFSIGVDGQGLQRLTDSPGFDGDPLWSPDGKLIAFASDRRATMGQIEENEANGVPVAGVAVFVMDPDGSSIRSLLRASDLGLPAGGRVFVSDWRS